MEDFIRIWHKKASEKFCKNVIETFENIEKDSELSAFIVENKNQFSSKEFGRRDAAIFLETPQLNQGDLCTELLSIIHECFLEYISEFSQLQDVKLTNRCNLKIQKTGPRGGYHTWHYESNAGSDSWNRELVWMVYLNDMPIGEAETEFFYQHKRIVPTEGTVVIWPAAMTHVHRGNTVYTRNKYIATGWWYKS